MTSAKSRTRIAIVSSNFGKSEVNAKTTTALNYGRKGPGGQLSRTISVETQTGYILGVPKSQYILRHTESHLGRRSAKPSLLVTNPS